MKLELATFPVKDVRFSRQTSYSNGVLEVNKEELLALVLEDSKIATADLDVAFPNEQTRIVKIRDVVEPRIKVSGPGCVFPGIMGPVETVGEGRTHRLSGVTVIPSADYSPTIIGGTTAKNQGLVDMWGPGAQMTPFGSTINIVLIFRLIEGVTELEAHAVIQSAEFRLAHRLAETTRDRVPKSVEVFELFEVDPSLPRVVYILACLTGATGPHAYVAFYGLPIRESLPVFVHPNEFLDGAVTVDARQGSGSRTTSWGWMNQPVVLELLRKRGKHLNFLGVILQRTQFEAQHGKLVTASATSQMARLLGANGAIMTKTVPAGADFIDVMLTVQACEKKGVKTVLMIPEWGGSDGTEVPLVFYVPEATAMVSTGSYDHYIKQPAPTKVIGARGGELLQLFSGPVIDPWSELTLDLVDVTGGLDWWGDMCWTRKEY